VAQQRRAARRGLDHGAVRGQVAADDREPWQAGHRVADRPDRAARPAADLGQRLAEWLARCGGDGQVEVRRDLGEQRGNAAGVSQVRHQARSDRADVGDHGDRRAGVGELLQRQPDRAAARDRAQVDHRVRRPADGGQGHDRVAETGRGQHIGRPVPCGGHGHLRISGSFSYTSAAWAEVAGLLSSARIRLGPLITHRFPLHRFEDAYEALRESDGPRGKVMLDVPPA
jgi:hypothetical protein